VKNHFKTIVISDLHLGTNGSKAKELVRFLKMHSCEKLILNGDIIDGWQLKKYGVWKKKHTKFIRQVMKMIDNDDTQVIYTRGNHDDFLDNFLPLKIGKNFSIVLEHIHYSNGKRYLVTHGDVFDSITTNMKWLSKLGDIGYTFLLWLNKVYNNYRTRKGLPYYSLSQKIKSKAKSVVNFISDFEQELVNYATDKKCEGVICGHIHQPAIKMYGNIEYLNSGDWVESLSALVEDFEGEWSLVYYNESTLGAEENEEDEEDLETIEINAELEEKIGVIGKLMVG
jgi:UDP-2,3-diacylglucosamine pyrophosphatase LpxH